MYSVADHIRSQKIIFRHTLSSMLPELNKIVILNSTNQAILENDTYEFISINKYIEIAKEIGFKVGFTSQLLPNYSYYLLYKNRICISIITYKNKVMEAFIICNNDEFIGRSVVLGLRAVISNISELDLLLFDELFINSVSNLRKLLDLAPLEVLDSLIQ